MSSFKLLQSQGVLARQNLFLPSLDLGLTRGRHGLHDTVDDCLRLGTSVVTFSIDEVDEDIPDCSLPLMEPLALLQDCNSNTLPP